jgi:Domain of unknown function (DUF4401)
MSASRSLWAQLHDARLVEGNLPPPPVPRSPWYVRVMLGVAGWIGALFLLGFVGVGFAVVIESATASFVVGVVVCAVAALLLHANPNSDFFGQFGMAISFAGQLLMGVALLRWFEGSLTMVAVTIAVMQGVLFTLIRHFIHRVWTSGWALVAVLWVLGNLGLHAFAPAGALLAFLMLWLVEFDHPRHGEQLRAAGYGIALATVLTLVTQYVGAGALMVGGTPIPRGGDASLALGKLAMSIVLIWAAVMMLRRERVEWNAAAGRIALAGTVILALISWKAPGVGPATAILVMGFANGNRLLAGLGIVALLGYSSHYYYALHATLLEKSVLLVVSGMVLLALRMALRQWWPKEAQDA